MTTAAFAGTGKLTRLAARRDRLMVPAWTYVLTALVAATAYGFRRLFKSAAQRQLFAASAGHTTAFTFLYGPLQASSIGGLTAWRYGVLAAVGAAIESIFLVIRHTRGDEEAGRLELVGSASVGRPAPLTAGLLLAAGANAVLVALLGAVLVPLHVAPAGSFTLAATVGATGVTFGAVAAVAAQVSGTARGARGIALAVLGVAYLLRGAGDAVSGVSFLSWASPLGWVSKARPFAGDRWWVLALPAVVAIAAAGAAYLLAARRDHGSGLLRPRPGPATGGAALSSPLGLAWRLHRGPLLGWTAAVVIGWSLTGAVARTIRSLFRGNSQFGQALAKLGGQSALVNDFFVAIMGLAGLVVAGYAVSVVLRLRSEESAERAEPLLATPTGRIRWAASHLTVALAGSVFLLVVAGLAAGVGYGSSAGDVGGWVARLVGAALGQLPAALVVAAFAVALFGLAPDWAIGGGWAAFVLALVLVLFGPVLNLSHWVVDASPFLHSPKLPGTPLAALPLIWLTAVAAALTITGLAGLRRRDIR